MKRAKGRGRPRRPGGGPRHGCRDQQRRLGREIEASRAALTTGGVACEITGEDFAIASANSAVLAMALREAVTYVIRHAAATRCRILLEQDAEAVRLRFRTTVKAAGSTKARDCAACARLSAAGGRLRVQTGNGTEVIAAIPVAVAA